MTRRQAALIAAILLVGCSGSAEGPPVEGIVADGLTVAEVATGLEGPTQLAILPDGRLLVAELNGGESDGVGRVVAIDEVAGTSEVLFEGLLTPTGVAVVEDRIWVMEERTLSHGPIGGGRLTTVLDDLPFNGRSETTLTPTPGGTLLYGTTGSIRGGEPVAGSGILWEITETEGPNPISAGFKNAYAHTFDADGGLWVTEVSDGRFDGEPAPDELVAVTPGVDHAWPRCVGDRVPVEQYGGDEASCQATPASHALFDHGATPTSVAVAPWDPDVLVVALWVEHRVVAVPRSSDGAPHQPTDVITGDLRPQHLLADGDRLLVVDFDGGRILSVAED